MNPTRMSRSLAVVLGAALLAAGCGSSDGDNAGPATTVAGSTSTPAVTPSSSGGAGATTSTTTGRQPATIDEWEALWSTQRAAVVKRIKDNNWGKSADGKSVSGPAGFTIDLTKCAPGWSDTEGLSDTSIKIGLTLAASGSYADYNNYNKGAAPIFDYYSAKGAFTDVNGKNRKVDFESRDDGYDPAKAIPLVDEFLDSDKVFAMWTSGSPQTLKTYDKINQRCVVNPLAITGHAAWGDPVNHPWTTGFPGLGYASEAVLWGSFLEQHLGEFPADKKITVAALVVNNDFGKLYDGAFKNYVAASAKLKDRVTYVTEKIEPQVPTITDPMTTLASKNPDMFIYMGAATPCTQSVTEAAQNGMRDTVKYLFQPNTCAGTSFIKKEKVGGDGSAADGWWIANDGRKDITDVAFANDAYVVWAKQLLQASGVSPSASGLLSSGILMGWTMSQVLMIAGQLPGGLTRTNVILAQRAIDMTNPMYPPGIKFRMDGGKDAYFIEAGHFQQWDAAQQTWVSKGDFVDNDGQSPPCAWDAATATCK